MPVSLTLTIIGQPGRLPGCSGSGGRAGSAAGRRVLAGQSGGLVVSGAAALPVGKAQVRARVAFRELAADRPASGPGAAARRDAGVILILAGPAVDAFRTIPVIEPGRVQGAPPIMWIMRPRHIQLPFNRAQESGEPGLAFRQQLAYVGPIVPGPLVLSLNVNAHKTSPA